MQMHVAAELGNVLATVTRVSPSHRLSTLQPRDCNAPRQPLELSAAGHHKRA